MSAETENAEVQITENTEPETTGAEITAGEDEAVNWNDVPEPDDDPLKEHEQEAEQTVSNPESKPEAGVPEAKENSAAGGTENGEDVFSFLNDLDAAADGADSGGNPVPAEQQEKQNIPAEEFNADTVLSGLEDPEMKSFAEDYPEEAKFVAKLVHQMLGGGNANEQMKRIAALEQYVSGAREQVQRQEAQNAQTAFEQEVLKIHPDAKEIMTEHRKEFADWLKKQPVYLQRRFRDSSDPEESADILTRYKAGTGRQTAAYKKRTGLYRGFGSGGKVKGAQSGEEVGWNSVRDEDVPEY